MNNWIADKAQRLDLFLGTEGRMQSRSKAQKAIDTGLVTVNGKVQRKESTKLEPGDVVALTGELPPSTGNVHPVDLKLEILYEDDACMVINKPAGIAVHPGAGMEDDEKTLLHGVAHLFKKHSLPFSADSVLVHRLDKETTGCILVAKNSEAHVTLQKQFESRSVEKIYLALVAGVPEHATARIDSPIGRSAQNRTRMSVRGVGKLREARTTYTVLAQSPIAALVECDLHTGRTHQVRVHLQSIGHPVLGDPTYCTPQSERISRDIEGLCLHAWKLTFESPADDKRHSTEAPLPSSLRESMKKVGIEAKIPNPISKIPGKSQLPKNQ